MHLRSLSILATSTFFALLGCPLDEMSANTSAIPGASEGMADNTESHDDRVDAASDVTWAASEVGAGRSALRVLMTDAPLDADNVFVTICGIHVHSLGTAPPGVSGGERDPRDPRTDGAGGTAGAGSVPGAGGRAEPGVDRPEPRPEGAAGAAGAGAGGAGGEPAEAPEASDEPDADYAAADDAELPSEDAPSDEADSAGDADPADDAEKVDEAERPEDRPIGERPIEERPVDGRDPGRVPPADGEGAAAPPEGAWLAVSEQCQTLDLLTLRDGVTEAVGVAALPPGYYGQIRLLIADASVVVGGVEHPLTIPSGSESGVKINGGFALFDGEATTLTLDFDAGQSVHFDAGTESYFMRPVISLLDVADHAAPGTGGDRGADPGVAGAGGRDGAGAAGAGAGGAGGAEGPRGEPRPPVPGEQRPPEPRPEDKPLPPEPGAAGAGAGGAPSDGLPPEEEPEGPDAEP